MIAIKAAHLFGGCGSSRQFAGLKQFGANYKAHGEQRRQVLIVSAYVHGGDHAEQRLAHVERGLGLRRCGAGKPRQHERQDKQTATTAQKSLLTRFRRGISFYSLRAEYVARKSGHFRGQRDRKSTVTCPIP